MSYTINDLNDKYAKFGTPEFDIFIDALKSVGVLAHHVNWSIDKLPDLYPYVGHKAGYGLCTFTSLSECTGFGLFKFTPKVEEPKPIRPEDEVVLTLTYGELAEAYAVLGKAYTASGSLWDKCQNLLDKKRTVYDDIILNKQICDVLKYAEYKEGWLSALFPQPSAESEYDKQIRELREQAESLLAKAKELESSSSKGGSK